SDASQPPALPSDLPVIPLRGAVVLPLTVSPLGVSRAISVEAVNSALTGDRMVLLLLQKNDNDEPTIDDLYTVGTVAIVRKMAKAPTGSGGWVEGGGRPRAESLRLDRGTLRATVRALPEPTERSIEVEARVRRLQELVDPPLALPPALSPHLNT